FIAAWEAGQWLANQVLHRASDAAGARIAVQEAAESELKAIERAIRKEAEAAKAEAGRRTEICTESNSDLERLKAEKGMGNDPREDGAGWWINFDPAIEQLFKEKRCVNEYAMQAVPSVMSEEDWLITMASGHLRGKSGLFVSTSSRVIFLAGAFRIKPELELPYASVTSVVETGEQELTVSTSEDDFVFKIKEPQDMLAAIRGGMPPGPVEEGAA